MRDESTSTPFLPYVHAFWMTREPNALELDGQQPRFPSAVRMFAVGIPFWIVIVLASTSNAILRGYIYRTENLSLDSVIVLLGASVGVAIYTCLRSITDRPFARQIGASILIILVVALPVDVVLKTVSTFIGYAAADNSLSTVFDPGMMLRGWLFWIGPFGLWSAACLALLHDIEARRRERRVSALAMEANEAQFRALRYQVNPHFLYNTLSSISTLILDGEAASAEQMTVRLAAFYRSGLAQDPHQTVRLIDEVELQRLYLDIEQIRFSDTLNVVFDLPEALEDALVPSLILQPLVENSIKHGLQEAGKLTTLSISAKATPDRLIIRVSDDGRGIGKGGGTGVGLANVRRRLATLFGDSHDFAAGAREQGGYQVRLEMPLRFAP